MAKSKSSVAPDKAKLCRSRRNGDSILSRTWQIWASQGKAGAQEEDEISSVEPSQSDDVLVEQHDDGERYNENNNNGEGKEDQSVCKETESQDSSRKYDSLES